jgi:ABC-type polysaccharide/polyol phosphate export permease
MGSFYPIIAPFVLLGTYVFVFDTVFKIPIDRYPEFLMAGLLPWTFLTQTLGKTVASLSSEPELIRKSPFPYELLPLSATASNSLNYVVTLGIFVAYLAAVGRLSYRLLPVLLLPVIAVTLLVMSLSMILALIDVYNHDLRQVLGNLLTVWFFLIPIVYRNTMTPKSLSFLESVDPMNMIVGQMRAVLYYGRIARPLHMIWMVVACTLLFSVSLAVFRRFAQELPQDI